MATPVVQVLHSGRMRYRLIAITAVVALASAGCGSSDDPKPASAPAATSSPSATVPASPAPDPGAQVKYLTGLAAIDPDLAANQDRAMRRVKDICLDVQQGEITGDALNKRVAERLSGGDAQITAAQAAKVVELAKTTVC